MAPMVARTWTEDGVLRVLWTHFTTQDWAAVPQVTVTPPGGGKDRRIDLLCVQQSDTGEFETLAIEVKVSRSDFLSDVANPGKQAAWRAAATRHAYAAPAGVVQLREVPEGSGLLVIRSHGSTDWGWADWERPAPYLAGHRPPLPAQVWSSLVSRASGLEGHTRGWRHGQDASGSPQELRAALAAAHRISERDRVRAERAEGKAKSWHAAYALAARDGLPCEWCGRPVKPLRPSGEWFKGWGHVDPADDTPCLHAEGQIRMQAARDEFDAADQATRDRRVRLAHASHVDRFSPLVESGPWRAFLDTDSHGVLCLHGPGPKGVIDRPG